MEQLPKIKTEIEDQFQDNKMLDVKPFDWNSMGCYSDDDEEKPDADELERRRKKKEMVQQHLMMFFEKHRHLILTNKWNEEEQKLWEEEVNELNALSELNNSTEEWSSAWDNFKTKLIEKSNVDAKSLSPLENKIYNVLVEDKLSRFYHSSSGASLYKNIVWDILSKVCDKSKENRTKHEITPEVKLEIPEEEPSSSSTKPINIRKLKIDFKTVKKQEEAISAKRKQQCNKSLNTKRFKTIGKSKAGNNRFLFEEIPSDDDNSGEQEQQNICKIPEEPWDYEDNIPLGKLMHKWNAIDNLKETAKQHLYTFLDRNRQLIKNFNGSIEHEQLWSKEAMVLNSITNVHKTGSQWKESWDRYKVILKEKKNSNVNIPDLDKKFLTLLYKNEQNRSRTDEDQNWEILLRFSEEYPEFNHESFNSNNELWKILVKKFKDKKSVSYYQRIWRNYKRTLKQRVSKMIFVPKHSRKKLTDLELRILAMMNKSKEEAVGREDNQLIKTEDDGDDENDITVHREFVDCGDTEIKVENFDTEEYNIELNFIKKEWES